MNAESKARGKRLLWIVLVAWGAFFIFVGAARGEVFIVFQKAVNICLECIGIG